MNKDNKIEMDKWVGHLKELPTLIDKYSEGYKKGELVIITARQGVGKSLLWDIDTEKGDITLPIKRNVYKEE